MAPYNDGGRVTIQPDCGSMAGDGCTLAVHAGMGANLCSLVAGPEDNKKEFEIFSSETLKEQLGHVSWATVFEGFSLEL